MKPPFLLVHHKMSTFGVHSKPRADRSMCKKCVDKLNEIQNNKYNTKTKSIKSTLVKNTTSLSF